MNRSVINFTIAAGLLCAGAGVAAAPALADTDDAVGVNRDDSRDDSKDDSGGRPAPPTRRSGSGNTGGGQAEEWPCELSRICPAPPRRSRGDSAIGMLPTGPVVVQIPQVAPVEPAIAPDLDAVLVTPDAVVQPVPASLPAVAAPQIVPAAPVVVVPRAPVRAEPPAPPPAAPRAGAVTPRAMPAPPPKNQGSASEPSESLRLGYPEELRNADFAQMAALALPGLAALLGMTAAGGLVGYRQAKAGYLMPAAGAGRFLQ